jgi:hypothetical protein
LCLYPTTTTTTTTISPSRRGAEDEWGRSVHYGTPPPSGTTVHVASVEQYDMTAMTNHRRRKCVVQDVWGSFARQHWPHHAEAAAVDVATLTTTTLDENDDEVHEKVRVTAAVPGGTRSAAQITKDDDDNDIMRSPSLSSSSLPPLTTEASSWSTPSRSSSSPTTTIITANIPRHPYRPSGDGTRLPAPRQHAKLSSTSSNSNNLLHFVP